MRPVPVLGLLRLPLYRASSLGFVSTLSRPAAVGPIALSSCPPVLTRRRPDQHDVHRVPRPHSRGIHVSDKKESTMMDFPGAVPPSPKAEPGRFPLSVLPLSMILRSLATTIVSSSPFLLARFLRIMAALANTSSPLLNPDKNPLLWFLLKKSFYAQFCAGENALEVRQTVSRLKDIGFTGVILGYAKEVVVSDKEVRMLDSSNAGEETRHDIECEIDPWTKGTLDTVRLAEPGDFVALKFTGAGRLAVHQLSHGLAPTPHLAESIKSICQLAQERGVRLLFDAEQHVLQDGIDNWTMSYSRIFNTSPGHATIYGTYQAYKKFAPQVLSRHLAEAQKDGFTVGIKLVRGAYLGSDPRQCFHDTKAETDACYDDIAAAVITRQWSSTLQGRGEFPAAHIVLATHNIESVRRARVICDAGGAKCDVAFAQLQGMADEVSCELVEASQHARNEGSTAAHDLPVYKYLVWGTTSECMKYLLRRAQENKDAVQRTRSGRDAMWAELVRRVKSYAGLVAA